MKHEVATFVSMKQALKELKPYILDGDLLENGRPLKNFGGMRPRELLGNWLICAALNSDDHFERYQIYSDPNGGDGVIHDVQEKNNYFMEHVLVPRADKSTEDTETLILMQINKKHNKGKSYAKDKILVVFINKKGKNWIAGNIVKKMPPDLYFDDVWIFGLQDILDKEYKYNVILLNKSGCLMWEILILDNFESWNAKRTN